VVVTDQKESLRSCRYWVDRDGVWGKIRGDAERILHERQRKGKRVQLSPGRKSL